MDIAPAEEKAAAKRRERMLALLEELRSKVESGEVVEMLVLFGSEGGFASRTMWCDRHDLIGVATCWLHRYVRDVNAEEMDEGGGFKGGA